MVTPSMFSAGTPNPSSRMTRMSGSPRKVSVKAVAKARTGKKTGPRRVRMIASASPKAPMIAPQITMIRTLSQKPSSTAGKELTALSQLK